MTGTNMQEIYERGVHDGAHSRGPEIVALLAERDALRARLADQGLLSSAIDTLTDENTTLKAQLAEVERDAARYRFLRERMEVRPQQAVSGSVRDALTVRVGCAFLDSPVSKRRSISDPDAHETGCKKFDAAIDAFLGDKP